MNFLQISHADMDNIFGGHLVAKGKFGLKFSEYKSWWTLQNSYYDGHGFSEQAPRYLSNSSQIPMGTQAP